MWGGGVFRPLVLLLCLAMTAAARDAPADPVPVGKDAKADASEAPKPIALTAEAQIEITVAGPGGVVAPANAPAANPAADDDEAFLQGAHLETSFEADRLLRRAHDFIHADPPQYRKAVIVLQHVIEEDANVLATADRRTYHPVREIAERTIVDMGPEGLSAYRTEVDGQVKALLAPAGADRDVAVLRAVESRFFLSSRGDEAAFALASLYLDQHACARARRLLVRLADVYPDLSVPRGQVLLRLALACQRSGDASGARAAWDRLEALERPGVAPEVLAAVRAEVAVPPPRRPAASVARRTVAIQPAPALPAAHVRSPGELWVPVWQRPLDMLPAGIPSRYLGVRQADEAANVAEALREQLRGRWEESAWVPAGRVLIDGENLFVKSNAALLCLDTATGRIRWQTPVPEEPEQKSSGFSFHCRVTTSGRPQSPVDILAFADEISKAVSVIGDTVYHIEDHAADQWTHHRPRVIMRVINGKQVRTQGEDPLTGNRLAAYDRRTGKRRWRIGRTKDESDPYVRLRFLAPPVACGERLLVPVEADGELSLAALDSADGSILWRTFLCSLSIRLPRWWDEIGLLAEGGDVYVASGEGVVFSLDGVDGTIHWAARYARSVAPSAANGILASGVTGWRLNRLFLDGRRLLLLPVDAEAALLFDTGNGRPIGRHPTPGLSRCLGAAAGRLWAAGPDRAVCLDLGSGRTVWDVPLGAGVRGYGCGFLAGDAVYVPVEETLVRLDRATGRRLATLRVLTPDDVPVGNVTTDGRHVVVLGPGRVYGLAAAPERLAQLDRTLATSGPALAVALDALEAAARECAAAHRTIDGLQDAIAAADQRLNAFLQKEGALADRLADAETDLADLQAKQAALRDQTPEAPEEAAAQADAAGGMADQVAEALRRRDALAAETTELADRIADARTGCEQLSAKQADAKTRAAALDARRDARQKALTEARRRHVTARLALAKIEHARARYDRAASFYGAALKEAGPSSFREEARRGLLEVHLARAGASTGPAARSALADARQFADGPAETVRIQQAVAETYDRDGDPAQALATYMDIARTDADVLVVMEAGHESWRVSPAGAAAEGIRSLIQARGEAPAPLVRRHAAAALEEARAEASVRRLRTVLQTFPGTEASVRAGLDAVALAEADGRFETAELILHEMRRSRDDAARASALAGLARIHQDAGWTTQSRAEWRRLADAFPETEVVFGNERHAAGALAQRQLEDLGVPVPGPSATLPPPPWRRLWKVEGQHLNLLVPPAGELRNFGHAGASQFLLEHALIWTLSPSRSLACRRLRDGRAVYACDLTGRSISFGGDKPREGHVVIARSGQEVAAIGLVSGEVLWSRKEPVSAKRSGIFHAHMIVNLMQRAMFRGLWSTGRAATGALVFCPDPRSVRSLDLATGRVLWQRTFRRRTFSGIQEAAGLVCLVMDGGRELMLCDATTGTHRGTLALDLGPPHAWSLVMLGDGFLAQPRDPKTGAYGLAFRDLPTGRERWHVDASPQPRMVYPLDPQTVCLVEQGRTVEIRDLATGALRGRCDIGGAALGHLAAASLGPTGRRLYVVSRQGMQSGLVIADLETGEAQTYAFGDKQAGRPLPAELYAATGEYLPYVERVEGTRRYRVRFLRRSDGQPAEDVTLPSSSDDGTFENLSTLVCRGGVLLVVTNHSVEAFGHASSDERLVAE